MAERLLEVRGLKTHFFTDEGVVRAVDGVDLYINKGETLGVVGESGCGKSVTALSIMRLIPQPPGRIVQGQIVYNGRNLLDLSAAQMRKIRGKEISMIFQEPMTSLNPVFTVGEQIAEAIRLHEGLGRRDAMDKTVEMLKLVHIPNAERRVKEYPHQLSGGMRQRVLLALGLLLDPQVIILDEPTTALDILTQRAVIDVLRRLKHELGFSMIFISHDLSLAAELADRIGTMYAGRIVELGDVNEIFYRPRHPYTLGLLKAVPTLAGDVAGLSSIPGSPPDLIHMPSGCKFHPRCPYMVGSCVESEPELFKVGERHVSACFRWQDVHRETETARQ
jgi:oligopeptide/dipeptide ABC transporter ATP-binding protein